MSMGTQYPTHRSSTLIQPLLIYPTQQSLKHLSSNLNQNNNKCICAEEMTVEGCVPGGFASSFRVRCRATSACFLVLADRLGLVQAWSMMDMRDPTNGVGNGLRWDQRDGLHRSRLVLCR
jgi:hypothetical protein